MEIFNNACFQVFAMMAHAYLRVSGRGQVEGDGFPRQFAAIQQYAGSHEITIARVFREKGVSGTVDGVDRPAWVDMITCARDAGVKVIVIEKLDRLARDLMIQERILADLKSRGVTLISVAEPHAAGATFQAITEALNAAGMAPRRGLRWHPHAVARIAKRPM
jgi:DNA invertase Pin-like site-specific DNA recombinase